MKKIVVYVVGFQEHFKTFHVFLITHVLYVGWRDMLPNLPIIKVTWLLR